MAGEFIEDVGLDLMKYDNNELNQKCKYPYANTDETKQFLQDKMKPEYIDNIINSPQSQYELDREFERIYEDREELRLKIFRDGSDKVYLPVNFPRFIWNAKEKFKIRKSNMSDLHPKDVID